MSSHSLKYKQFLPVTIQQAWDYFSSPHNLKEITPPDMDFKVLNDSGAEKMYAGQIITYTVKPIAGIPMFWMTEIKQVSHQQYFIDEQRIGPYSLWHHSHFFTEVEGGVEMTDLIHYKLPLGFIGRIFNTLFVKKKLESIFAYRKKVLAEKFSGKAAV